MKERSRVAQVAAGAGYVDAEFSPAGGSAV
jgi:hypothetical protein